MPDENKSKLVTIDEAIASLDARREAVGYGYGRGQGTGAEQVHLRDYWRIIRRRLWIPTSVILLVVTLTTIYNLRLPSIYEGVTKIEIGREDRAVNIKDVQISM
ncbi:MAG: hypothetical protein EBU88_08315, partial [Acidobacteria bacterium]|nr:hypothetical protein [Acidobacteriota bacterium]